MTRHNKVLTKSILATMWRASLGGLSAVVIFSAVIGLLRFATPLYLLQVLDRVPDSRSVETLVMLTAITLVAVASGLALELVRRWMLTRWGIWLESELGPHVVRQCLSSSGASPAGVDRMLGNVARMRLFVSKGATSWLDIVWVPICFLAIFSIHPLLGMVAVSSIALLMSFALFEHWTTREAKKISDSASRRASDMLETAVRNRESAAAHSMAGSLTERWRQATSGHLSERERLEARRYLFRVLARRTGDFLWILMIAFGVWLFLLNEVTLGAIFAARVIAGFSYRMVERAVRDTRPMLDARAAYQELNAFLSNSAPAVPSVPARTAEAPVVLDMVSFKHPGERDYIFRQLSLELARGEMFLVTGAAATGKTTLSRLLVGGLEPRYGQIRFGDVDVQRLPAEMRGSMIGYMSQHTELFDGTIRQNIARMHEPALEEVMEAARLVGIHDLIVRLPDGYDTVIGPEALGVFSGSERKRIALARAFFQCPRLIVLDEPTANLDSPSRRILETAIAHLKQQGCSIVVTQGIRSSHFGKLADKFMILGGKPSELTVTDEGPKKVSRQEEIGSIE